MGIEGFCIRAEAKPKDKQYEPDEREEPRRPQKQGDDRESQEAAKKILRRDLT